MSDQNSPTPERIFQRINALQSSAALKGALELGLFTALGSESKTAESLSKTLDASEKGVRQESRMSDTKAARLEDVKAGASPRRTFAGVCIIERC